MFSAVSTKTSIISLSLHGQTTKVFFPFFDLKNLLIACIESFISLELDSNKDSLPSTITTLNLFWCLVVNSLILLNYYH